MDHVAFYAIPSIVTLIIKLWLLAYANIRELFIRNWAIALIFIAFCGINIIEILTYATSLGPSLIFTKFYNAFLLLSMGCLLLLAADIAGVSILSKKPFNILNRIQVLIHTPFTKERKMFNTIKSRIAHFLSDTSVGNKVNLKALTDDIEKQIVSLVIRQSRGNQARAAEVLGISNASVSRKSTRHRTRHKVESI